MRTLAFTIALLTLSLAGISAQDAKPASTGVAGKWRMSFEAPQQGPITIAVSFKQEDGKAISGTFEGPQGEVPLKGEFGEGKLSFAVEITTPNGPIELAFTGELKDEKLAGSFTTPMGEIAWTAERAKE